jgi:hypothetical protein
MKKGTSSNDARRGGQTSFDVLPRLNLSLVDWPSESVKTREHNDGHELEKR